ncbi:DNA polymerase III subunit delta' [Pelomonas aquatica]|jgi:DNA polymerase-3 subunit delta'|uniref:DNA polymerase III subunit delta n=1 Tax=Pelomonas aquatica TaxID=431058 RepID=A0A9X4LD87_9BURK|nr:DNA polymerase III subunit delta' [Pelomonas aquatica]MCY4755099.1 DNA polymerase III subunit delta' [Pelomonas aquatica]MDG0860886.1 DNA polymerase III subunit delta' [Pelomonas aquatica]
MLNADLPWLQAPLADALVRARSHALLVQGPAGVGQLELAVKLAQSWLCEAAAPGQPACNHCPSCKLFASGTHPDFQLLMPEALEAPARESLGLPFEEPDAKAGKAKPSREIKVEAVRGLLAFAQATSARGRAKVAVIFPAEALNGVAANALLKTLEEPSGLLRFVLASHDSAGLLPTIRSRCQPLPLALPERAAALAWLVAQGVEGGDGLLDATGGRPQQALAWSEAGLTDATWQALPKRVARGEVAALSDWAPPRAIDALQRLCHDLLRRSHGQPGQFFAAGALPAPKRAAPLLTWDAELRRAARHADHPLNAGLWIEALVAQAQAAMAASLR